MWVKKQCVHVCVRAVVCASSVCSDLWGGVARLQRLPLLHVALVVAGDVQPFAQRKFCQRLWLLLLLALSVLLLLLLVCVTCWALLCSTQQQAMQSHRPCLC